MRKRYVLGPVLKYCLLPAMMGAFLFCNGQKTFPSDSTRKAYQTVIAGKQYERSRLHQSLWGKHYRKEWNTPVTVPQFYLESEAGGLHPYEPGGGRQTKSLKLRSVNEREYVLRSIDKDFGKALPAIFQGTIADKIIKDQGSIGHPYAALTIPSMAEAARIYHTNPIIVHVPNQTALQNFDAEFGNRLYLFEQRPEGNWEDASNFGNSKDIISTEVLLRELLSGSDKKVDQRAYIRARLFDIFIGDWGRHEDQWRWASFKEETQTIYRPIPRDRDQVYTKFDGLLLGLAKSAANMSYLQSFEKEIKDVNTFNFQARNLDRRLANEMVLNDWTSIAKELQGLLTDKVIENSVKKLPPEVFSISGEEIIAKLKSRRDQLVEYAEKYYRFIAEEVDIPGTLSQDFFEVLRINDNETTVKLYSIDSAGNVSKTPFYSRKFMSGETKEIRIYGISSNDIYHIDGEVKKGITVRLIGGRGKDIYADKSAANGKKAFIYDDHQNEIITSRETVLKLSENDPTRPVYKYDAFLYDRKGIKPELFYDFPDKLYVGVGYKMIKYKWNREPFASLHAFHLRYSIPQNGFSFTYEGFVNKFVGKWNLELFGNYDLVRWTNFFGLGNETPEITNDLNYYRMRSKEIMARIGLNRRFGRFVTFSVSPFYRAVDIIRDTGRFVFKEFQDGKDLFVKNQFGGGILSLMYSSINDPNLPTRGLILYGNIEYGRNLEESSRDYTRYTGVFEFYLPLSKRFIARVRTGASTVIGETEFYQMNPIGGVWSLRGFRRDRYWGNTSFYSNQELQYLVDFKSSVFNGKAGLLGFYDIGRVWLNGEKSNQWHSGYGGGIIIAPFNKFSVAATYGISQQDRLLQLRFNWRL